jgi:uncharacterized protein
MDSTTRETPAGVEDIARACARAGLEAPIFRDPRCVRLVEILLSMERVAVAYSGGVDSTLLLRVAHGVLGERAVGVLGFSESIDRGEFEEAKSLAARLGIPLEVIETREYENPEYRKNDAHRCYHCKDELFQRVKEFAVGRGIPWVADGSNADDARDYRPGRRARAEHGVRSPLEEAGLDKLFIRDLSLALGLPTWDKPAAPCLSSRIPYGSEVSAEKLRAIEAAEKGLRALGFRTVRVRHHGQVARVEVPPADFARILSPEVAGRAVLAVKGAGFLFVALDVEGFRSGSLNAAVTEARAGEAVSGKAGVGRG